MGDRHRDRQQELAQRLEPFRAHGLIDGIPTWDQIRQGELEMLPYVLSTDITNTGAYRQGFVSHPLVRQPLLLALVGRDHARPGLGLDVSLRALIMHLHLTYHQGMPKYDLQLVQTHPDGLDALQRATESVLRRDGRTARRDARIAGWLLTDAVGYHEQFLGPDGWIERARRFDYPDEECGIPREFSSVTSFINYCLRTYPKTRRRLPARLRDDLHLASRMFREGRRLGWFR